MVRRTFCKALLAAVVVVFSLFVLSGEVFAQGRSADAFERVAEVQERHTEKLMARKGVVGTAVGLDDDGGHVVLVLLEDPGVGGIPEELEGVAVEVMITGKIYALADPTARFGRPVPIGVSTGHPDITAGTIGCRVVDGSGNVYALSNNHVFANENLANIGDAVIQPGTYDGGLSPTDDIGTLVDFEPIVFSRKARNELDAAIATVLIDGGVPRVGKGTPSDGYGTPNEIITEAFIGQNVQKYGRTTGLTHGTVTGVNATVKVGYGPGKTAKFVKQILIEPGNFSDGGDSGSLIVTDDEYLNPVGLLFAGSSSHTIANRIDLVLDRFGVAVDGAPDGPPPLTGSISGTVTADGGATIGGAIVSVDTGESATTASDGSYFIDEVPIGDRLVTASASGFVSQGKAAAVAEGTTSPVDFSLDPAVTGNTVSVVSIDYATEGGKGGTKHLLITVALWDDLFLPVAGASVSIDLFRDASPAGSGSATTGPGGTVTFTLKNARSGEYTTHVTDVTAAGLDWNPDDLANWSEPYSK